MIELLFISESEKFHKNPNIPLSLYYSIFIKEEKRARDPHVFDYQYAIYYSKTIWQSLLDTYQNTSTECDSSISKINSKNLNEFILENKQLHKLKKKTFNSLLNKKTYTFEKK